MALTYFIKNKKIIFACALEAGSVRAFAVNSVKFASAFAEVGYDVTLITKNSKKNFSKSELKEIYGITHLPKWITFPRFLRQHLLFGIASTIRII